MTQPHGHMHLGAINRASATHLCGALATGARVDKDALGRDSLRLHTEWGRLSDRGHRQHGRRRANVPYDEHVDHVGPHRLTGGNVGRLAAGRMAASDGYCGMAIACIPMRTRCQADDAIPLHGVCRQLSADLCLRGSDPVWSVQCRSGQYDPAARRACHRTTGTAVRLPGLPGPYPSGLLCIRLYRRIARHDRHSESADHRHRRSMEPNC